MQVTGLRDAALLQMLGETRGNLYEKAAQTLAKQSLQSSTLVNPILGNQNTPVTALFNGQGSDIGRQLRQVARLIEARATIGLKRQVFFVRQSQHDTHTNQLGDQQGLLGDLSLALKAFSDSMQLLGLDQQVTTFTLSDFGRTFKPAVGGGTDHGWGNYAFVMGGAVKGGDFYGRVPVPVLGGPDDLGEDGRSDSHHVDRPVRRDAGQVVWHRCRGDDLRVSESARASLPATSDSWRDRKDVLGVHRYAQGLSS